jgi:hypothetical protein
MYLENRDSVEKQAVQRGEFSKLMRIHNAKHGNVDNELFEWFCNARANNIAQNFQQNC